MIYPSQAFSTDVFKHLPEPPPKRSGGVPVGRHRHQGNRAGGRQGQSSQGMPGAAARRPGSVPLRSWGVFPEIWVFPDMGGTPKMIHFYVVFSINHPFIFFPFLCCSFSIKTIRFVDPSFLRKPPNHFKSSKSVQAWDGRTGILREKHGNLSNQNWGMDV